MKAGRARVKSALPYSGKTGYRTMMILCHAADCSQYHGGVKADAEE